MTDLPRKQTFITTRHEWVIGEPERNGVDAKTFGLGMATAQREMQELGVDLSYDNAYRVRGEEDGTIVLFVEIEGRVDAPVRPAVEPGSDGVALLRPVTSLIDEQPGGDAS